MERDDISPKLSSQALKELKQIAHVEMGRELSDEEVSEMGIRLLRLFDLLTIKNNSTEKHPTDDQRKALNYIQSMHRESKRPTVRGIAQAIGRRSSRSGARMLESLVKGGYLHRRGSESLIKSESQELL